MSTAQCTPCDREAFNCHTPKSLLPLPRTLSPTPFHIIYYRKLLKTKITLSQRLDTIYWWRNEECYAMECNIAGCKGVMYIQANLQLGSMEHLDKCKHQAGLHFNTYHGNTKPDDQRHPSIVKTLGTAQHVESVMIATPLMTFFDGLGLPKNSSILDVRVPTSLSLYKAIVDTNVNHEVVLKEQLTPIFSFHVDFNTVNPQSDANPMYERIRKCMSGNVDIKMYFLLCHVTNRWRLIVPALKVDVKQAIMMSNMLSVSSLNVVIEDSNYVKPLTILLNPSECLCFLNGIPFASDELMGDKVQFLHEVCVRSPSASSTFSPCEGFPYGAKRYAKEAKNIVSTTIHQNSIRLVWSILMNGLNSFEMDTNVLCNTPQSFRIVQRTQSITNLGGDYEAFCYDAEGLGWYDSVCPFQKVDHEDGKVFMKVRVESKVNFPIKVTSQLHCSVCQRSTNTLSCGDGEMSHGISLRNPDHIQRNEQPGKFKVEDAAKKRIVESYIQNQFYGKYKKVSVKSIYTDKTGSKYYIYVEGGGSGYCLFIRSEHKHSRVWFYLDKAGISQKCFGLCKREGKDFQSNPKQLSDNDYAFFFENKPLPSEASDSSSYADKLYMELLSSGVPPPKRFKK